jgi:glycosyltransferase involved in cell wall biosynthesis
MPTTSSSSNPAASPANMRSIQIIASIASQSSGPTYSVARLSETLSDRGLYTQVFSVDTVGGKVSERRGVRYETFAQDFASLPALSKLMFSSAMKTRLSREAARAPVVLHHHGLWRMVNIYPARFTRTGVPLILSPRGMLGDAALEFSSLQKRIFWRLLQESAVRPTTCFHATAASELDDIRAFGLGAPVAVIPNGIDVLEPLPERPAKRERTVLSLGRVHQKKGIDTLLRAWALGPGSREGWQLRIVGPAENNHDKDLRQIVAALNLENVVFQESAFGDEKRAEFNDADIFVLPTRHENFGIVVAEALAEGTPVISTIGAPWQGLQTESCGWWVKHGPEALAAALNSAMSLSDAERDAMGVRGRDWMRRDFAWDSIGEKMERLYQWCAGEGDRPEFVVT